MTKEDKTFAWECVVGLFVGLLLPLLLPFLGAAIAG